MKRFTSLTAALLSAGILVAAFPAAHADEIGDLKAAVQQLQAEVQQLKMQQAHTAAASTTASVLPANAIVVTAAPAPAPLGRNAGASLTPVQNVMSLKLGDNAFTLYGDVDQYFNYMHANGQTIQALNDGAILKSRLGMLFVRDMGAGYKAEAQIEQSLNFENGNNTDTPSYSGTSNTTSNGRLFDRQAWAGLSTPHGEFRIGRQNTAIFYAGGFVDYTARTMGSVVNSFGVPSRFDGDIAYIAPRIDGLQVQAHYAVGSSNQSPTASITYGSIMQLGADYLNGPWRLGYAGIDGRSTVGKGNVTYSDFYANYDYGRGTIYANYVRSNNGNGALNNVGGPVIGSNSQLAVTTPSDYYNIYQISADYRVSPKLRIGALYGLIRDSANSSNNASGYNVGAYYDAFKNVTFYAFGDAMDNNANASFGFVGSAGAPYKNFPAATVKGQKVEGIQIGALYRF